ncbi:thiamine pyrophosphate-binding protein [Paenibacillus mesophilus]|nr:thiamine pyrophosphate-binding protein [Paenibacillus mesophilus]
MQATGSPHSYKTPQQSHPARRTVAQAILELLGLWGVRRIYGVVGDAVFGLIDALAKQNAISFITVKHESVAAMMASAEAKLTGRLAVCLSHMGPGLTNLVTGLGDAFLDKAPVLAITGQAPLNKLGTPYKQSINQQQLVQAVSSYSQSVVHPDAVMESMSHAMYTSIVQRTVSHLSIPSDVFTMLTTAQPYDPPHMPAPLSDPAEMRRVSNLLQSSRQPILLVGNGARSAREPIRRLAETWGCGTVNSYGTVGIVPESHPSMLNGLGEGGNPLLPKLLQKADVVLAIETKWPDEVVPKPFFLVQLAKRPTDSVMLSPSAIWVAGDANIAVPQWIDGLSGYKPNAEWVRQVQECKQAWATQNDKERNRTAVPLYPASVIRVLESHIADDALIALDEGDSTIWFLRNFRANRQNVLLSERWRAMGFGLPAALAAKCCSPDKQVVCITGDGGLGMVMSDLLTASRYGLLITVIVFNNGRLQMEHDKMLMKHLRPEGTEITNPDFVGIAEACGWHGYLAENEDQLEQALIQSRNSDKPVLLNVITAAVAHPDFGSH